MSLPDPPPARKLSRWGLYIPFILLGIGLALWSGAWFWAQKQAALRMDAGVADLARAGYPVTWKTRTINGYPFRMDITLTEVTASGPSGWSLRSPLVEGEAPMHALGHWLIATPRGLTFVRPIGGPVTVNGKMMRGSLTNFDKRPPSISFEGVGLTFAPEAGAQPFALSAADRVEFHLRAGPDDEGGVFASVTNGKAALTGLFARIADGKPVSLVWNSTLSRISAFEGRDWPQAVQRWTQAGGKLTVRNAGVTAGEALIGANGGTLTVDRTGRLAGALEVTLRQAPRALGALGDSGVIPPDAALAAAMVAQARETPGVAARATITFQAGQTTLGPIAIGASPKVYDAP